jgi:hypothetical protein
MGQEEKESMATETFLDKMKTFGARLGLPKVDVDKLIDMQLKNIDAFRALRSSSRRRRQGARGQAARDCGGGV